MSIDNHTYAHLYPSQADLADPADWDSPNDAATLRDHRAVARG
jgi:hypothetical protein